MLVGKVTFETDKNLLHRSVVKIHIKNAKKPQIQQHRAGYEGIFKRDRYMIDEQHISLCIGFCMYYAPILFFGVLDAFPCHRKQKKDSRTFNHKILPKQYAKDR